jgi:hypothetical protein
MEFIPGDRSKESLKARGLSFETIIEAIAENGIAEVYQTEKYPGQIVIVVDIAGYMHCVPCEPQGSDFRIISGWPSRKHQRKHKS